MPYSPKVKIIDIPESEEELDFEKRILAQLMEIGSSDQAIHHSNFFLLNGHYSLIYRQKEKKKSCPKQVYQTFYM